MTKPLILKDEAFEDIEEAAEWYDQHRAGLGNRFARSVAAALDAIQADPKSYGKVWRLLRARMVRSFPFVIYYRDMPTFVEVVAVIHAKRNPKDWKSRV